MRYNRYLFLSRQFFLPVLMLSILLGFMVGLCRGESDSNDLKDNHRVHDPSEAGYDKNFLGDFFQALKLVEQHFVEKVDESTLLNNAIRKLVFITPPYCQDNLASMRDCPYNPYRCFSDSIMIISMRCGYDPEKLSFKALDLLLKDLDPYSSSLDSAMTNELKIAALGRFAGVGMAVGIRDDDYVVISPFEGSPAYKAGIRAGDKLLEIDGVPLHGLTLMEALKMVRGRNGSEVRFKIQDPQTGDIHDVKLRRTMIKASSVRTQLLGNDIGYLRISNFQKDTREEVLKSVNKMKSVTHGKMRGLILDLRDNPGGLFSEAIRVSDLFLTAGVITSLRSRGATIKRDFSASGNGSFDSLPVIVIINSGSASASEILAGALQNRKNSLIIGSRSFGKASVQDVFPIRADLALRLTTAHYYTANGNDIEGTGIRPDITVSREYRRTRNRGSSLDTDQILDDPEVKMAYEYLISNKSGNFSNNFKNLF